MESKNDKKEQWYFIRGLIREAGHWDAFFPYFREKFPHAELIALDLPGTGKLHEEACPTSVNGMMERVRLDFLGSASRSERANRFLVAVSLGGMVAVQWLVKYPGDFRAAVIMNPSLGGMNPLHQRLRWDSLPKGVRLAWDDNIAARERIILELVSNNAETRERALPEWIAIQQRHPVSRNTLFRQLIGAARFTAPKNLPEHPVLLLNSTEDRLVDPSCSLAIHHKWNWPIIRHPWAGHDLSLDDPQWVVERIAEWRKELSPPLS